MIFTTCPKCGQSLEFNDDLAKTNQTCKYCGVMVAVPEKRKFQLKRPEVTANGDVIVTTPPQSAPNQADNGTADGNTTDTAAPQAGPQIIDASDDSWFTQRERSARVVSESKRTSPVVRLFVRLLDLSLETAFLAGLGWLLSSHKILAGNPFNADSPAFWVTTFLFTVTSLAFLLDSIVYLVCKTTFARCIFSVFILRTDGKPLSRIGYLIRNFLVYLTGFGAIVLAPVCLTWQAIRILRGKDTFYDGLLRYRVQYMPRNLGVCLLAWCVGLLLFFAGIVGTWHLTYKCFGNIDAVDTFARGWDFEFGNSGKEINLKKAFACYSLAAQAQDPDALYRMGLFYDDGIVVARDTEKARECWKKAAELDCEDANVMLNAIASEGQTECKEMLSDLEMVRVNPGSAYTENGTVTVAYPYWIGTKEVTWKTWNSVMGKSQRDNQGNGSDGTDKPVDNVSWKDANRFCKRLNKMYEQTLPDGYRFALPTEKEWIFATKGGRKANTADFAFGDDVVWHSGNANGTVHRTGEKSANPLGLYDTCGNVWEWLEFEADDDALFTIGGSWMTPLRLCRPTERKEQESTYSGPDTGLRIVLTPR